MPLAPIEHAQTYRVFFGSQAKGNIASVLRLDEFGSEADMQAIANQLSVPATCFYTTKHHNKYHSSDGPSYAVRWFSAQGEIQLCGHGSIALCRHLNLPKNQPIQIDYPKGTIRLENRLEHQQDLYWFSTIAAKSMAVHEPGYESGYEQLIESTLKQSPEQLQLVGDDQGYLLAELGADLELGSLTLDLQSYASQSNRALIIVRRPNRAARGQSKTDFNHGPAGDTSTDYDYELRYFAPQYSALEDSATGSANAIAAQYLMTKYGATQLRGYQSSPDGGRIFSQLRDGELWIGGAVQRQSGTMPR